MNESNEATVVSLGSSLSRKQAKLWRMVEQDIFIDSPNYIPGIIIRRSQEEKEFFLLYQSGKAVGRVAVTIDRQWIAEKKENLGFIDDFVISPEYKHLADMLIEPCLSSLRQNGLEGVIVRSHGFPALAAQEFEELPPLALPCNPPWYIDLFEEKGFVKYKEWGNFRFTLPPKASETALVKWEKTLTALKMDAKPLNFLSRRELREYSDLTYEVLVEHFGYLPMRFVDSDSIIKYALFGILCRFVKLRIYVIKDSASGKIVGFFSFCPDYNIALQPLTKYLVKFNPFSLPKFIINLRRTRRGFIASIGLAEAVRGGSGLIRAMDYGLKLMREEGYVELDTGPVLIENKVVVKMARRFRDNYELQMQEMRYHSLFYHL